MKHNSICFFIGIVFVSISATSANAIDSSTKKSGHKGVAAEKKTNAAAVGNELEPNEKSLEQKNLDLSLPESDALPVNRNGKNSLVLNPRQNHPDHNNLLEIEQKTNSEGLHLKGGLLLSPYQEAEKQKLVDGARIIFSLRR